MKQIQTSKEALPELIGHIDGRFPPNARKGLAGSRKRETILGRWHTEAAGKAIRKETCQGVYMTSSTMRKFAAVLAAAVLVATGAEQVWAEESAAVSPSAGAPAPSKAAAAPDMAVL
jgi:hypothetical protein